MQEKLSVRKVYRNAYRYVRSHPFAFIFLTIFYFLGSLLPMITGADSFKLFSLIYMYVFFYFAAGFYFKQQFLSDKGVFLASGFRFLTAVVMFLSSIFVSSLVINIGIYLLKLWFGSGGAAFTEAVLDSPLWLCGKYIFIFLLFVAFFIVPSFAFVSEITGKSRSVLMTYAKTKGNLLQIAVVALTAFALLLCMMIVLTFVPIAVAALARAAGLAFISILYFKMYDFFYNLPQIRRQKKEAAEAEATAVAAKLKALPNKTPKKPKKAVKAANSELAMPIRETEKITVEGEDDNAR